VSGTPEVGLRVPIDKVATTWSVLFDDEEAMRFIGNGERRTRPATPVS
jgi:hypothetical protein